MINKRLLVKSLLAHNDENSFYDKKRQLNIGQREGKAKFLKHICALSNSNPANNSYIVVGVEDESNEIVGVDFFDDSKIQNLINAYLDNPPIVLYENILFPHLPEGKVVGLVTIRPIQKVTSLRKNIWKYYGGSVFFRDGSTSMSKVYDIQLNDVNSKLVETIEQHAKNNIKLTLDGVFEFMEHHRDGLNPKYKVFKEFFVVCWAGLKKTVKDKVYYSRIDIELINEQVKLFYSALDEVEIEMNEDSFSIIEYVRLGLYGDKDYFPLEKVSIDFSENGVYSIETELLFEAPQYDKKTLHHIYNSNNILLEKIKNKQWLNSNEKKDILQLPATYMLCYLNDFEEAKNKLMESQPYLLDYGESVYLLYKESMRILRKIKYSH
jgi:hypothetical protein